MSTAQITFLGHATLRLTLPDERVIIIDPWLSENPACPDAEKSQPRCDYMVLTHGHFDHTADAGALIQQHKPHVIAMFELAALLEKQHSGGKYHPMGLGGTQEVDGVRFSLTRAYHSAGYSSGDHIVYAGTPAGVVISAPPLATIYHAGDTDVFSDMQLIQQLYAPKVIMLPIGDHFTMGPKAAAIAAGYFDAQTIIPIHHGTFPLLTGTVQAFKEALGQEHAARVLPLSAGESANWTETGIKR